MKAQLLGTWLTLATDRHRRNTTQHRDAVEHEMSKEKTNVGRVFDDVDAITERRC